MISCQNFYDVLSSNNVKFFTGVPDSLLKDICSYITDNVDSKNHIIATNEGGAIGLAMGYHLATKSVPLVYMQNSGFGNTINPLLSLADPKVYGIPMILLIGWRGEPNVKDEPQHIKQGEISEDLLKTMDIPYFILEKNSEEIEESIKNAIEYAKGSNGPFAILVRKNTFDTYSLKSKIKTDFEMNREEAIIEIEKLMSSEDIVVATTGKTSRELFELRARKKQKHSSDFLTVGGMGHASQIALGISISKPNKTIYCFDGDGAVLMHAGSLGIVGNMKPANFKHIVFNNGAHDSVGGQPTIGFDISFKELANVFNYRKSYTVDTKSNLIDTFKEFKEVDGPSLLEIKINKGSREDLGRPTISPNENKINFIKNLHQDE